MEENKENQGLKTFFISVAMFFITTLGVGLFSYLFGMEDAQILRNSIVSAMGIGVVLFLMAQSKECDLYDYDNKAYYGRFFVCYLCGFILAVGCGKLPAGGWPFVPLFVLLALFSNTLIGICCGLMLLMMSLLLSGAGIEIFFLYFTSGTAAVCVFRNLDQNFKVGVPIMLSLAMLMVSETANIVLFVNEKLNFEQFMIPIINVTITAIFLIGILKLFSYLVINKYRDRYMEINDPECPLLVELKNVSREEYYKAVHTAYLSDKIAKKLGLDAQVTKAGGYYHKIGSLHGENNWEHVEQIGAEYRFPPEVLEVLKEYLAPDGKIIKKEASVIYFAEAIVSSILFLLEKEESKLDYDQIIDTVFKKKQESNTFRECELSIYELNQMKKIFKEEKLYYDFLR